MNQIEAQKIMWDFLELESSQALMNLSRLFTIYCSDEEYHRITKINTIIADKNKDTFKITPPREAKNEIDFKEIFERELKGANLKNTIEDKLHYGPKLITYIKKLVFEYEKIPLKHQVQSIIKIANEFCKWLIKELDLIQGYGDLNKDKLQNLFCNTMSLDIPIEHFKVLTKQSAERNQPLLTNEQLDIFIKKAFCGNKNLPSLKFHMSRRGDRSLIQAQFYDFYNANCYEYFHTAQCQPKFICLLTDNFEDFFFEKVKANFKPKKLKRL